VELSVAAVRLELERQVQQLKTCEEELRSELRLGAERILHEEEVKSSMIQKHDFEMEGLKKTLAIQLEQHAAQAKAAESNMLALQEAKASEISTLQLELTHVGELGRKQLSAAESRIADLLASLESTRLQERNSAAIAVAQINAYAAHVSELQERLTETNLRHTEATGQMRTAAQQQLVQLQVDDARLRAALLYAQEKLEQLSQQKHGSHMFVSKIVSYCYFYLLCLIIFLTAAESVANTEMVRLQQDLENLRQQRFSEEQDLTNQSKRFDEAHVVSLQTKRLDEVALENESVDLQSKLQCDALSQQVAQLQLQITQSNAQMNEQFLQLQQREKSDVQQRIDELEQRIASLQGDHAQHARDAIAVKQSSSDNDSVSSINLVLGEMQERLRDALSELTRCTEVSRLEVQRQIGLLKQQESTLISTVSLEIDQTRAQAFQEHITSLQLKLSMLDSTRRQELLDLQRVSECYYSDTAREISELRLRGQELSAALQKASDREREIQNRHQETVLKHEEIVAFQRQEAQQQSVW
jgi:hypothetical protein